MTWWIVLLVAIGLAAVAALVYMQWRSTALRRRFGPEYERAVAAHGDRRQAEAGLREIARRRDALDIRPLEAPVRARYRARWHEVQLGFVDGPEAAVRQADLLVTEVLDDRGYPTDDRDERTAMVSADHPDLVAGYRSAPAVAAGSDGASDIDRLREAFVQLRELFDRLVAGPPDDAEQRDDGPGRRRITVRRPEPERTER